MVFISIHNIFNSALFVSFPGTLDLTLSIRNYTPIDVNITHAYNASSRDDTLAVALQFYQLFMQLSAIGNVSMETSVKQLPGMDDLFFRRPNPSAEGIVFPVRVRDETLLQCIWEHAVNDRLSSELDSVLVDLDVPAMLNLRALHLVTNVNASQLEVFKQVAIPYQGSYVNYALTSRNGKCKYVCAREQSHNADIT